MPLYEHVFLARQDASAQQVEELTAQMTGVVEQHGGKVTKTENWGVRSLTYRMNKNRKAHFVLLNIDAPSAAIAEIERQERISEEVIRYLSVRVEELEEGPSAMMRKADRDRERDDRGGGFRGDRDGGFRGDPGGVIRPRGDLCSCPPARALANGREVPSSAQNVLDRAMPADREYDDRHTVFLGKRERGCVHDPQAAIHGFLMVEAVKAFGLGIVFRIRSIYPIDIGSLENGVTLHLSSPQNGRRVGGEIRISGATGKHDDPVIFQVTERPLPLISFAHLRHCERGHSAGAHAGALDRGLQDQRIHDCRQHTHGVRRRPRQAVLRDFCAAQNIAAADHDPERDAEPVRGDEIGSETLDRRLMNPELFRAAQRLAGQFDDDAPIFRFRHWDVPPLVAADSGKNTANVSANETQLP